MSFIPTALAATPSMGATPQSGYGTLILLVGFIVIFYFLLWRPQSKRAKQHRELVAQLAKGDEVITSGGLLGRITKVEDDFLSIEIAQGVEIRVQKHAVSTVLPKGSLKAE